MKRNKRMPETEELQKVVISNGQLQPRQETLNNETYTVYPVVMLTEGVHSGSAGPTFYPAQALANFYQTWNGVPVTLGHPEVDGQPVSANHPEFYNNQVVGKVFNTRFEDNKLKAEIWLNNNKINTIAPDVLASLQQGVNMDVSTGLFDDGPLQQGEWNGEQYSAIVDNIRPDHLALLPGETGACSWADGCGVRANKKEVKGMRRTTTPKNSREEPKNNQEFFIPFGSVEIEEKFTTNQMDYSQMVNLMHSKIDSMDIRGERIHYLRRMFPDFVVYKQRDQISNTSKLVKRSYRINQGSVEWTSDPVIVEENISYTEIPNTNKVTKNKEEEMSVKTMKECCPKKVDELIKANSRFTENDKDWLLDLTEDAFARTIEISANEQKEEPEPKTNKKEDTTMEPPEKKSFEDILANADPDTKKFMLHAKGLAEKEEKALIDKIKSNKLNQFTDEELASFDLPMLEKLAAAVPTPKANYTGAGGENVLIDNEEVPPLDNPDFDFAESK